MRCVSFVALVPYLLLPETVAFRPKKGRNMRRWRRRRRRRRREVRISLIVGLSAPTFGVRDKYWIDLSRRTDHEIRRWKKERKKETGKERKKEGKKERIMKTGRFKAAAQVGFRLMVAPLSAGHWWPTDGHDVARSCCQLISCDGQVRWRWGR